LWDSVAKQTGQLPREAAVARARYIAVVDNQVLPLLRDTFGAAFTQKEGETLRNTLGDPNKSPAEKKAVLRSFIEQKRRDLEALAMQSGQTGITATQGGGMPDFSAMSDEELEGLANGQ
jgi:dephospho-CoA kinase